MKKLFLFLFSICLLKSAFAQKTEFRVALNSGLFSYRGASSEGEAEINDYFGQVSLYNPYASKNGLSYGLSLNLERITKNNFIYGIDAGYEVLRSKINITHIFPYCDPAACVPASYESKSNAFITLNFLNLNSFFGFRLNSKNISYDLTGGIDLALSLKSNAIGSGTATRIRDNATYNVNGIEIKNISSDFRPRIQLAVNYKRYAVYVGYSYGLSNFLKNQNGESYSRLIRFGVSYKIK